MLPQRGVRYLVIYGRGEGGGGSFTTIEFQRGFDRTPRTPPPTRLFSPPAVAPLALVILCNIAETMQLSEVPENHRFFVLRFRPPSSPPQSPYLVVSDTPMLGKLDSPPLEILKLTPTHSKNPCPAMVLTIINQRGKSCIVTIMQITFFT